MERVVEIHVAGLAEFANPSAGAIDGDAEPYWIDAHGTPIPGVLFDLLDQVLADPGLTSLKGVALEVDTKPIGMIVEEFRQFRDRFGSTVHQMVHRGHLGHLQGQQRPIQPSAEDRPHLTQEEQAALEQQYRTYVHLVTTPDAPCSDMSLLGGSLHDLNRIATAICRMNSSIGAAICRICFRQPAVPCPRPMSLWSDLCRSGSAGQDPSRRTMIFSC